MDLPSEQISLETLLESSLTGTLLFLDFLMNSLLWFVLPVLMSPLFEEFTSSPSLLLFRCKNDLKNMVYDHVLDKDMFFLNYSFSNQNILKNQVARDIVLIHVTSEQSSL